MTGTDYQPSLVPPGPSVLPPTRSRPFTRQLSRVADLGDEPRIRSRRRRNRQYLPDRPHRSDRVPLLRNNQEGLTRLLSQEGPFLILQRHRDVDIRRTLICPKHDLRPFSFFPLNGCRANLPFLIILTTRPAKQPS